MQRALVGLMVMTAVHAVAGCDRSAPAPAITPPLRVETGHPPTTPPSPSQSPSPPPSIASAAAEPATPLEPAPAASETPGRLDQVGSREEEPVKPVLAQTGTVAIGSVVVSGASVADAGLGVARMRAGFKSCYHRSLYDDSAQQGELRLALQLGPDGAVRGVEAAASGRLSGPLISCVKARARHGRFELTDGDSATVTAPVTFALTQ